ncbi:MAG: hypothetical protein P1U58_07510 [Verrucomicrobiales bacterium]|nr:hypothetical protein [Verrucomicrobiales bacterium]
MKTTLILAVITILSLGTLAIVRAQDVEAKSAVEPQAAPVETTESPTPVSGIRTDVVVEQKLLGGTEMVTAIPVASVFAEGDHFFVLAKGAESDIDFRETEVTLGNTDGLNVEIKTGLFPGDEVLTVSVGQLRFPAFDDGPAAVCGVGGCTTSSCDLETGECTVECKDRETCEVGAKCEDGKTCTTSCTDCANCESGVACAECPDCSSNVDLTISADEFFNGSLEVVYEPAPGFFMGQPGFCPPY